MATATATSAGGAGYPIQYDVAYPDHLSRGLIFIKWLLAIPHIVVLYLLTLAWEVVTFIAFFAILFTKKYPAGLFKFSVGVRRWQANVNAYVWLLRDEYPPFSMDPGQYAVAYDVAYPEELSRWLIFVKWLLIIPNVIVMFLFAIVAWLLTVVAWFAILFTGAYPRSLFTFVVGVLRWSERVNGYLSLFTDAYPPFSTSP
ncbi:MAG TPA: DUF4389 domain-containing protein [Dehalococcoidia bacterium]|nr:DUF4389 domain-containing protein [Dehalococcoidia bacterium]